MVDAITLMGAETSVNETDCVATVKGVSGSEYHHPPRIDARQSGTTSRFILPVLALGTAKTIIDGDSQLRSRPFEPLFNALRSIGGQIENLAEPGQLPVSVSGPAKGGKLQIAGHLSSQFVSGLLIAGAMMPDGLEMPSGRGESHPPALTDSGRDSLPSSGSCHPAGKTMRIHDQWAKSAGECRLTPRSHFSARRRLVRSRLYFCRAQRMRYSSICLRDRNNLDG